MHNTPRGGTSALNSLELWATFYYNRNFLHDNSKSKKYNDLTHLGKGIFIAKYSKLKQQILRRKR